MRRVCQARYAPKQAVLLQHRRTGCWRATRVKSASHASPQSSPRPVHPRQPTHARPAGTGERMPARDSCSAASAVDGLLETNEFHTGTKTSPNHRQAVTRGTHWRPLRPRLCEYHFSAVAARASRTECQKTSAPTAAVVFTRIWTDGSELG